MWSFLGIIHIFNYRSVRLHRVRLNKYQDRNVHVYADQRRWLRGQPVLPPIIENRPSIYHFYPLWHPIFLLSLRQWCRRTAEVVTLTTSCRSQRYIRCITLHYNDIVFIAPLCKSLDRLSPTPMSYSMILQTISILNHISISACLIAFIQHACAECLLMSSAI